MPVVRANGAQLHYEDSGHGDEVLLLAHGLLMDHTMYAAQRRALEGRFRVIAYDHRGQGLSPPAEGGYDMDTLCDDAAQLIHALGLPSVHVAGLSMGGFVGLRLAARHPDLVRSLVLMDTSADAEPWRHALRFRAMQAGVALLGVRRFVPAILPLMFGASTLADPAQASMVAHWRQKLLRLPRRIVGPVGGVIGRDDVHGELAAIRCPVLVVVGEEDRTTPPHCSERLAAGIAGAELLRLPGCGHSCALEQPGVVAAAIEAFLARAISAAGRPVPAARAAG